MVSERDKKRVMIPVATGIDTGVPTLRVGDDVPKRIEDAPSALKSLDQAATQGTSASPITLQAMATYLKALTTDPETKNVYSIEDNQITTKLDKDSILQHQGGFATPEMLATLDQLGVISEVFDADTLAMLRDPEKGLHEILSSIMGNGQSELQRRGGSAVHVSSRHAATQLSPDSSIVQKRVSEVLKRNRFNPDPNNSPYMAGQSAATIDNNPIGRYQTALGGYDSGPGTDDQNDITYEKMKKIGLALMLRATGAITKNGSLMPDGVAATEAGAQLPGIAQLLATRIIEPKSMWASDLTSQQGIPPGAEKKPGLDSDLSLDGADQTYSYGNMNSYIAPFGGFGPVGIALLASALVIAVKLLLEAFLLTISALTGGPTTVTTPKSTIPPLGGSQSSMKLAGGLVSYADLGITPVRHDYITAASRGIDVFFQLDQAGDYVRVLKSPGYYAVMVRAIIRSGGVAAIAIKDQLNNISNPVSILQAALGLFDVIKSSKIISFVNVLAGLGDNVLYLEDNGFISAGALGDISSILPDGKISYVDKLPSNAVTRVMKNRAKPGVQELAWKTSATPSMYILPPTAVRAAAIMTKDKSTLSSVSGLSDAELELSNGTERQVVNVNGRIDADSVKQIEDHLESEYVPFYFHDLRTNEIISFHAFLASCNESYTANYERSKYYGRVDPVMIYSDTDRSIDLSFHVAATSKKDFDVMWWKINKLLTLLYPQWSRGRKVSVENNSFIQPFSQVPTSSPMIRLRLGDLFRSNYSKFALARLFGLGSDNFALDGAKTQIRDEQLRKLNDKKSEIAERMSTRPAEGLTQRGFAKGEKALLKKDPARQSPLQPSSIVKTPGLSAKKYVQNTLTDLKCEIISGPTFQSVNINGKISNIVAYEIELSSPANGEYAGPYIIDFGELIPDPDFVDELAKKDINYADDESTVEQQAAEDFFKAENNVIVRSFESVRGRGLAGFITSISMDWKTPTWETDINSRAPQYCTLQMKFQPIHDIAPGIDSDGFNRAPIYNVGTVSREVASDPYNDDKNAEELHKKNAEAASKLFKSDIIGDPRT